MRLPRWLERRPKAKSRGAVEVTGPVTRVFLDPSKVYTGPRPDRHMLDSLTQRVHWLFEARGLRRVRLGGRDVYESGGYYFMFTYVNAFYGFVMESAEGLEEALKGRFEDGDHYSLHLGEAGILAALERDFDRGLYT